MLLTLKMILQIQVSSFANRLIYYLQRLPIIGKRVGDHTYAMLGLKKAAAVVAVLLALCWGLLSSMLYIGLVIFLIILTLGEGLSQEFKLDMFWHIFFILTFLVAGISLGRVLEPKRGKFIAVKLMRFPATRYMRATLSFKYITFLVYLLPAVLIFSSLLGASIGQVVLITVAATMWRIGCEYFHLWVYRRTGNVMIKNNPLIWTVIVIGFAAAYAPLVFDWAPAWGAWIITSVPFAIICIAIGIAAGVVLYLRTDYSEAVDAATKRDDPLLDMGRMISEAQKTSVAAKESDYSTEMLTSTSKTFEKKEGYEYINAIFFSRHKSLIRQPFYKRLAIVAAAGAVLLLLVFLKPDQAAAATSQVGVLLPFLILIMTFLTVGDHLCKALFFHCDLKLLRQSFYRQDAAKHFKIRLRKILGMNLLIATVLSIVLSLAAGTAVGFGDILQSTELLLLWVTTYSLALFFSVHHLFLYYIFQPYTTELNAKNPFFHLLSGLVSFLFIITINLKPDPVIFAVVTAAVSLLYAVAALVLVRKYSPRTFRVK